MENTSMATAPSNTAPVKKRKPQGPRVVKPKTIYIAINKSNMDDLQVFDDAEKVMDLQDTQPGVYTVKRHRMEVKRRAPSPSADPAPTA